MGDRAIQLSVGTRWGSVGLPGAGAWKNFVNHLGRIADDYRLVGDNKKSSSRVLMHYLANEFPHTPVCCAAVVTVGGTVGGMIAAGFGLLVPVKATLIFYALKHLGELVFNEVAPFSTGHAGGQLARNGWVALREGRFAHAVSDFGQALRQNDYHTHAPLYGLLGAYACLSKQVTSPPGNRKGTYNDRERASTMLAQAGRQAFHANHVTDEAWLRAVQCGVAGGTPDACRRAIRQAQQTRLFGRQQTPDVAARQWLHKQVGSYAIADTVVERLLPMMLGEEPSAPLKEKTVRPIQADSGLLAQARALCWAAGRIKWFRPWCMRAIRERALALLQKTDDAQVQVVAAHAAAFTHVATPGGVIGDTKKAMYRQFMRGVSEAELHIKDPLDRACYVALGVMAGHQAGVATMEEVRSACAAIPTRGVSLARVMWEWMRSKQTLGIQYHLARTYLDSAASAAAMVDPNNRKS